MAQRVCFLGRGGSGKSTVAQNLAHALAQNGYHVLMIGNDIDLSSTALLRGDNEAVLPALEAYREHYEIDIIDHIVKTESGVWCLELGSLEPGLGCMARGISIMDDMLDTQGVVNVLQFDYIFYDISGETPCTGYILPLREGIMQRCIIVSNGSFAAVCAANTLLQAAVRAAEESGTPLPIQLFINNCCCDEVREELVDFANMAQVEILAMLDYDKTVDYSTLAGKTVLAARPESKAAQRFLNIANCFLANCEVKQPKPFERFELIRRLSKWQKRELERRLAQEEL